MLLPDLRQHGIDSSGRLDGFRQRSHFLIRFSKKFFAKGEHRIGINIQEMMLHQQSIKALFTNREAP